VASLDFPLASSITAICDRRCEVPELGPRRQSPGTSSCSTNVRRSTRVRIALRTVDGSQGFSADLVIVDFAQTFCPGFTCHRQRVCVAIPRARQVEVVLMPRDTFLGYRYDLFPLPPGHDHHLLEFIYKEVGNMVGIITLSFKKPVNQKPPLHGCANCDEPDHYAKHCLQPMKCGNCGGLFHTIATYTGLWYPEV
jgi:hypothetical protein